MFQRAAGVFDIFFVRKGNEMKKSLVLALALVSAFFIASPAEAKASSNASSALISANAAAPQGQRRGQWRRRNNNRRVRVSTYTRIVRSRRAVYRETYQVRYLPNGRTVTRLIRRVRIR